MTESVAIYKDLLLWAENPAIRNSIAIAMNWLDNDKSIEEFQGLDDILNEIDAAASAGKIRRDYSVFLVKTWREIFQPIVKISGEDWFIDDACTIKGIWDSGYFCCNSSKNNVVTSAFTVLSYKEFYVSIARWDVDRADEFSLLEDINLSMSWYYDKDEYQFRTNKITLREFLDKQNLFVDIIKSALLNIFKINSM